MKKPYLEHVKEILEKQEIPSTLSLKAVDNKIDVLFIPFEGTDLGLSMTYISPELLNEQGPQADVGMLQYHVALPFDIDKALQPTVSEFVNRMNLVSPIPGWIFDRPNNAVHFRYVQVNGKVPPTDELVAYLMQVVAFYMTKFVPILVDVCTGKEKFDPAVKKITAVTAGAAEEVKTTAGKGSQHR